MPLMTILRSVPGVAKSQGVEFGITPSGGIDSCGVFTLLGATKTYLFLTLFTPYQILVQGRTYSELTRLEKEQLSANLANRNFEVKNRKFLIS